MAKARPLSELADEVRSAFQVVDNTLPLLIPAAGTPVTETERMDRLNIRREAYRAVLHELLDNEYE